MQNAPIERIGANHKRDRRYSEHDVHLGVVDLHTADERANDRATAEPVSRLETLFHLSGEIFQPTNQQPQLALERLRVRESTHLLVRRDDALALTCNA